MGYEFDAANRLQTVTDNRLANGTTYAYDDAGNLLSFPYPNGVVHTFTYDVSDRPTNLAVTKGGVTQASYAQTFSDAGRKLTVNENGTRLVNYAYDNIYRLLSETIGADSQMYTLDPVGNRLNRASTIPSLPTVGSAYDSNNRLAADSYDANGNTLASGGNSYGYDFEDRLTSFNGAAITMVYDGDGNRVVRTEGGVTTRYLLDELTPTGYAQVAEEVQAGAIVRRYTHGPQRISQTQLINSVWSTRYYGYDAGFSVRQLSDTAGTVTDTYTYDAFGRVTTNTGSSPNVYLYLGEAYEVSMRGYYLRARWLLPEYGRFLTADPYEGTEETPKSEHRYFFGDADPINYVDPSGNGSMERAPISLVARFQRFEATLGRLGIESVKKIGCLAAREILLNCMESLLGAGIHYGFGMNIAVGFGANRIGSIAMDGEALRPVIRLATQAPNRIPAPLIAFLKTLGDFEVVPLSGTTDVAHHAERAVAKRIRSMGREIGALVSQFAPCTRPGGCANYFKRLPDPSDFKGGGSCLEQIAPIP